MLAPDLDELAKLGGVPFVYFGKDSLVGFLSSNDHPYVDDLCSFGLLLEQK